ncbi:MAG: cache domain-containing protein [Candidatus Zixiibacteriota bacterium]
MGSERIKLRILIPLTIAIVGLLGAFISGAFRLLNNDLNGEIRHYLTSVKKVIKSRHHNDVEVMSASLQYLQENQTLRNAYTQRDRGRLAQLMTIYFHELKHNHNITHFSIHDPDGSNFLRLHQPHHFGDRIQRFTFEKAAESGAPFFGMELNPDGLFILRMVSPWYVDGKLLAYLEIGKELKYMTRSVPAELGVNVIAFVNKAYVDRRKWEERHKTVDSNDTWNDYRDFVIIDKSMSVQPALINDFLSIDHSLHDQLPLRFTQNDRCYMTSVFQLIDAQNRDVGDMMVFYDVTDQVGRAHRLLFLISTICVVVGLGLFVSFYKMLDSLEQELSESRDRVLQESRKRLEVEQKHARELARHVIEVEIAKTKALNAAREAEKAKEEAEKAQLELQNRIERNIPVKGR